MLSFEDFPVGWSRSLGPRVVGEDEIVAFARVFDPQPFHTDPSSPEAGRMGGLIASGWHTCALTMRMMCDAYLLETRSQGSAGLDSVRWLAPLRPGDALSGEAEVTDARRSRSMPGLGLLTFRYTLRNQEGTDVIAIEGNGMILTRDAGEPAKIAPRPGAIDEPSGPVTPAEGCNAYQRIAPGMVTEYEPVPVDANETVAFAAQFDPQPFHLDPKAARESHFGRLSASGWHTCALWMRENVLRGHERLALMLGMEPHEVVFGPSPGVRNLRWLHPVFAGDTLRFRSTVQGKRASTRRPGQGIVRNHIEGWNQDGVQVLTMDGAVTMPTG